MNTIIRIQVVSSKGTVFTRDKIQKAFEKFAYVVDNFSRFLNSSELCKLNAAAGKAFVVSKELFDLVTKAFEVANITNGAYDPTIIDLLEAYGYDKKQDFSKLADPRLFKEISKLAQGRPSFKEVKFDSKKLTIYLQKQQRIDLGSIGKGYAIDLAFAVLEKYDFEGFLINAGGDVRGYGINSGNLPWKLALYKAQLPNQRISAETALGTVDLLNKSICGSGGWARKVGIFHHLLNPQSGLPINEIAQCFVIADTATQA
ncbi:MAG: FAD:protein FMN transferase, partial [archaeon]